MKRKNMIVLYIILAYIVLLFDLKVEITRNDKTTHIEYNGLIWVGLDHYSIWKYDSDDKPMKWIKWSH